MNEDLQIAWAAGLFEGEGYISKPSSRNLPAMELASTDIDVLMRFHEAVEFRGNVKSKPHYSPNQKAHWKPQYKWIAGGAVDVLNIIIMLRPYMCSRRATAMDLARLQIEMKVEQSLVRRGGYRGATKKELLALIESTPWGSDLPWE